MLDESAAGACVDDEGICPCELDGKQITDASFLDDEAVVGAALEQQGSSVELELLAASSEFLSEIPNLTGVLDPEGSFGILFPSRIVQREDIVLEIDF